MIEADGLVKSFGFRKTIRAIDHVSFSAKKGTRLGFLGTKGSGKTTLLRILSTTLRPDEGTLRLGDLDGIRKPAAARRHLGYMPEGMDLSGWGTGKQYLRFWGMVSGIAGGARNAAIERVVEYLEVGDHVTEDLTELTVEMLRRITLAQALLTDPEVLILDEPMTGLSGFERGFIGGKLEELAKEGKTIVLSSHLLEDIRASSDRVAIMSEGRLTEVLGIGDLLRKIGEGKDARIFVDSDPLPSKAIQSLKGLKGVVDVRSAATATVVYVRPGEVGPDSIRDVLASQGIEVRGIREAKLKLGDVFSSIHP
ncbi:MAG: ABC transporter ATP-binding protein [Thermoplasmata archaeon]